MLCDPWLSPGGTFLGSWFQMPDNSHLRRPDILEADWVGISHEHLDHLDLPLLADLSPATRLVIPHYPAPEMRNRIGAAGIPHIVIELDAWERLALNDRGDWVTVIPEESPMCHDAAILVHAGGRSVLHTNDARLSVAQLRRAAEEVGGSIDLMGLQMSGASWHPICYEYPPEKIAEISAQKRIGKFKAVSRLLRGAPPRIAMPYAGPPAFLDPALAHFNDHIAAPGIFPDQEQAATYLRERLPEQTTVVLLPGDKVEVATGEVFRDPHWEDFQFEDLGPYLAAYARRRANEVATTYAAHPDPTAGGGLARRFEDHFTRLGALSSYFSERIDMTVRFDVQGADGGVWDVSFSRSGAQVHIAPLPEAPQYLLRVHARWLEPVLRGELSWEDLFLSLRISAWRSPDLYNDYLIGLLKHADAAALAAVERYETGRDPLDCIDVRDGESSWQVSRYCPHAGEDLTYGAVVHDGVLRCLGHNFEFDLRTGACLNARCDPLVTRRQVGDAANEQTAAAVNV